MLTSWCSTSSSMEMLFSKTAMRPVIRKSTGKTRQRETRVSLTRWTSLSRRSLERILLREMTKLRKNRSEINSTSKNVHHKHSTCHSERRVWRLTLLKYLPSHWKPLNGRFSMPICLLMKKFNAMNLKNKWRIKKTKSLNNSSRLQ